MRFSLIDRIVELEPGVRITAVKSLTMTEEYLADHFPNFPVMPGVLMLEAMTQAGAWLVRVSEDFAHSIVVLKQANNVKYGQFVEPGQTLTVTAEILEQTDRETKLKAYGAGGRADRPSAPGWCWRATTWRTTRPEYAPTDALVRQQMRNLFALLWPLLAATRPTKAKDLISDAIRRQDSAGDRRQPRHRPGLRRALAAEGAEVAFVYQASSEAAEALVAELAGARPAGPGGPGRRPRCGPGPADRRPAGRRVGSSSTCWSTRRASSATGCWAR